MIRLILLMIGCIVFVAVINHFDIKACKARGNSDAACINAYNP